jgi:hypothetical protein
MPGSIVARPGRACSASIGWFLNREKTMPRA